jgi:hypothetical protein
MIQMVKCANLVLVFLQELLSLQAFVSQVNISVSENVLIVSLDLYALIILIINIQSILFQKEVLNVPQVIIAQEEQRLQMDVQGVHLDKIKKLHN